METKVISAKIVNELYRARLVGENETDVVDNILTSEFGKLGRQIEDLTNLVDKKDTIISYILSFVSENDMLVVEKGITELENNL